MTEDNHNDTMLCAQLVDPELVERNVVFSFVFNPMSAGRKENLGYLVMTHL